MAPLAVWVEIKHDKLMVLMTGSAETSKNTKENVNELIQKAFALAALHPMYRNKRGAINQKHFPVLDIAHCMVMNQLKKSF